MAIIRTFKQFGQGFGPEPVSITVKLGEDVIFSGPVDTLDQDVQWKGQGVEIYSFSGPEVTFEGSIPLEISVANGNLFLAETLANYCKNTVTTGNVTAEYSTGPNVFTSFYQETVNGVEYGDPLSDEKIDGVAQNRPLDPESPGQWAWIVPAGSTFTATLNIQAGLESPIAV